MIRRIFYKAIDSVAAAALLVGLSSLVSRLLGVVRDRILAGQFGAGDELDVYYAAFRIPDLIFNLIVLGALSAGFIPVFSALIKGKNKLDDEARRLTNNVLNLLGFLLLILSVVGMVVAPWLMRLATPGFSADKLTLTIGLTRLMFLSPLLLGLSSVFGGVLQSAKRFLAFSLSPVFYNLGIIAGALFLVPLWGVYGLAWGVVGGSFLHAAVQLPALFNLGWRYQWLLDWRDKGVRSIMRMMTARTLALLVNQINLLVITAMASLLPAGSLAIFNLANNLQSFPVGIFGISFAIAVFPALAENAFNKGALVERLNNTTRQILFFIIPATVIILLLRAQIVRLILGSGQFDWEDTTLTMNSLALFALSFFAQALIPLLTRAFYARHDSKTPFYVGLAAAVLNVCLAWYLGSRAGVVGLALAFSLSSIANFMFLVVALRLELGVWPLKDLLKAIGQFCLAALPAGLLMQLLKSYLGTNVDMDRFWGVALQSAAATVVGLVVYLGLLALMKNQELSKLWASWRRRTDKSDEAADISEARGI